MAVRFTVVKTFDPPGRRGLLAIGRLTGGPVGPGSRLSRAGAEPPVLVLGVEPETPMTAREGLTTLVIDRSTCSGLTAGTTLTG